MGIAVLKHTESLSESTRKKIDLSNRVNSALVIIFIAALFIDIAAMMYSDDGFNTDFIRFVIAIVLCAANLLLNYLGYYKLTRILLVFILPVLMIFIIPLTGKVMDEYYFWLPYLPVASSVLPYYFFSEKHEKKWIFLTVGYYLILSLFSINILNIFAEESLSILPIIRENIFSYKSSATLIFIFINITLYYVFEVSRKYENGLVKAKESLDKKNTELELKNVELNRINATKNKFFHIIGHDLRAPIAQIIQISELFEKSYDSLSKADHKRLLNALKASSATSYRLLDDLFSWAQAQEGEIAFAPVAVNLNNLVEENLQLLHEYAQFKEIQIINNVDKNCSVYADINMLNTVIRNLISNAIKFTYHQGKIEINEEVKADGVEIFVQDNGKGISNEDLEKLFKIDTKISGIGTDNEKGTGIGLILCKEFVEYHKGKIWAESESGKGSKFIFFLPRQSKNEINKVQVE